MPLTWAKSRTRFSSRLATRGVPREREAIVARALGVDLDPEDPGRALDDQRQVLGAVVLEAVGDAEAVAQRRRQQAGAGRRADQGEGRQRQGHRAGAGALAEHDRQLAVLHRRVERLLDGAAEAVDLVDEEDAAGLQRGEEGGDVGLALQRRAGGLHHRHPQLGGDDVGERGLAEPGRAGEQDVVERLAAAAAASMKIASCSVTCAWLTKSASVGGRSERSRSSSGTSARASWTRTSASTGTGSSLDPGRADPVGADVGRVAHAAFLAAAALRSAAATSSCGLGALEAVEQLLGLQRRVAEVDQAVAGERAGVAAPRRRRARPPPRARRRPSRAARR